MPNKDFEIFKLQTCKQLLENIPLGQAFNPIQLETFSSYLTAFSVPIGGLLIEENQQNNCLYFLCKGSLDVIKEDLGKKLKILRRLSVGDVIGESSFFDHAACSASVMANQESVVLALKREQFIQLSSDTPQCALAFTLELFRILTRRLRATNNELVNFL
jgi:CRP/FNR family cyclic AMP-dependent transcriptional regulator